MATKCVLPSQTHSSPALRASHSLVSLPISPRRAGEDLASETKRQATGAEAAVAACDAACVVTGCGCQDPDLATPCENKQEPKEVECTCFSRTGISPCEWCLDPYYTPKECTDGVFIGTNSFDERMVFSTLEKAWDFYQKNGLECLSWHKIDDEVTAEVSYSVRFVPASELARRKAVPKDAPCMRCTWVRTPGYMGKIPKHTFEGACKQDVRTWEF